MASSIVSFYAKCLRIKRYLDWQLGTTEPYLCTSKVVWMSSFCLEVLSPLIGLVGASKSRFMEGRRSLLMRVDVQFEFNKSSLKWRNTLAASSKCLWRGPYFRNPVHWCTLTRLFNLCICSNKIASFYAKSLQIRTFQVLKSYSIEFFLKLLQEISTRLGLVFTFHSQAANMEL